MPSAQHEALRQLFLDCREDLESLLASRLSCRETASDLSQEAFLRLCRSDELSRIDNLKAYLFRIAFNLLNDHYRYRSVREFIVAAPPEDLPDPADTRSAEQSVLASDQLDRLAMALGELPPLCQRIFYLCRFEGMRQQDIATQLGVSLRTVEDNIKRALLHCARRLEV